MSDRGSSLRIDPDAESVRSSVGNSVAMAKPARFRSSLERSLPVRRPAIPHILIPQTIRNSQARYSNVGELYTGLVLGPVD